MTENQIQERKNQYDIEGGIALALIKYNTPDIIVLERVDGTTKEILVTDWTAFAPIVTLIKSKINCELARCLYSRGDLSMWIVGIDKLSVQLLISELSTEEKTVFDNFETYCLNEINS